MLVRIMYVIAIAGGGGMDDDGDEFVEVGDIGSVDYLDEVSVPVAVVNCDVTGGHWCVTIMDI